VARRTSTYAIRLAVEGGGQVQAELISIGQSGEQSLKRIETAHCASCRRGQRLAFSPDRPVRATVGRAGRS
jgi:hypothetical protein